MDGLPKKLILSAMSATQIFDYVLIATVAGGLCLGVARAMWMHFNGVRVVVVDWQRTAGQMLGDSIMVIALLAYCYLTLAYAWPLPRGWTPSWGAAVLLDWTAAKVVGAALLCAGTVIYAAALWGMGASWRIGIDRKTPGGLVTTGIFAVSRNPIYLALDAMTVGTFLIQGRLIFAVLALVIVSLIHETILREERFLTAQYGDAFADYRLRVGRYWSWPAAN